MTTDEERMRQERVSGPPMLWMAAEKLGTRPKKVRGPEMNFGSIVGGSPPCGNCESEPVEDKTGKAGDALFCSKECRDEFEGNEPSQAQKNAEAFRSMYD